MGAKVACARLWWFMPDDRRLRGGPLSFAVPPGEVEGLGEFLATLLAVKSAGLEALERDGDGRADLAEEVRAISELLQQLERRELSGPAAVVRGAVYGWLIDAADALSEACRSYEAGAASLESLEQCGARVAARLESFAALERADAEPEDLGAASVQE